MQQVRTSPTNAFPRRRLPQRTESGGLAHIVPELSGHGALDLVVEFVHDLRSPLTSILFMSETLLKDRDCPLSDLQRKHVGILYGAALGLGALATDVVDLAVAGDQEAPKAVPYSVGDLFESVAEVIRPIAEEKGLDLRIAPPADDERVGHRPLLNRVLLNLATNALKFTDEGRVEIAATESGRGRLLFSVCDTGHGIAPKEIETRLRALRRSGARGEFLLSATGLGLTTCQRLLGIMGSELEVESQLGLGTRFHFELDSPLASLFTS